MFRDQKTPDQLTEDDLVGLVTAGVPEGISVDYKRSFSESRKNDLAEDVAAFANRSGGWVFVGIEEVDSVPVAIPGVVCEGIERRIRQLEQMLDGNTEPRVTGVRIAAVPLRSGRVVFAIQVDGSLRGPHLVKAGEGYVGFVRGSKGNNHLDVEGLREQFLGAEALPERIRRFRTERVRAIARGEVTLSFGPNQLVILHACPLASFGREVQVELHRPLGAVGRRSWAGSFTLDRFNLEVRLFFGREDGYIQLFRSGVLEFVFVYGKPREKVRRSIDKFLCDQVAYLLAHVRELGVPPPVAVFLSLVRFHGSGVAFEPSEFPTSRDLDNEIDRDELLFPEVLLASFDDEVRVVFRPIIDMLWNALGFPSSPSFAADGTWARKEWRDEEL